MHPRCRAPGTAGVLVVDDDPALRELFRVGLPAQGFTAWVAGGAEESLALLRKVEPHIDLLLLDVNMPGMTGPQLLPLLHQVAPDRPVLFMTGDSDLTNLTLVGPDDPVIFKPFTLAEVAAGLREAQARNRGA